MQTPERLALIGGSILLASTLVLALRSQASDILPRVARPIQTTHDDTFLLQMQHDGISFADGLRYAKEHGWTVGNWGQAPYYIDKDDNLYIGPGDVDGQLNQSLGDKADQVQSIDFKENVRAPQISVQLLSNLGRLQDIQNLYRLDTSQVTEMQGIFSSNPRLGSIDLYGLDTHNVYDTSFMFYNDADLNEINGLNGLSTSNILNMRFMFAGTSTLNDIDLSDWSPRQIQSMSGMFAGAKRLSSLNIADLNTDHTDINNLFGYQHHDNRLRSLVLGSRTYLSSNTNLDAGNWQNGNLTLSNDQLGDGNAHPGSWVRQ